MPRNGRDAPKAAVRETVLERHGRPQSGTSSAAA